MIFFPCIKVNVSVTSFDVCVCAVGVRALLKRASLPAHASDAPVPNGRHVFVSTSVIVVLPLWLTVKV